MNKRGFTLIELLVVISIIAIISIVAVPNISNIIESTKKERILDDAKKLISLAKAEVRKNYDIRNSDSYIFKINDLNSSGEILGDFEGEYYDNSSYVKYENISNNPQYCITLIGSKQNIGKSSCVYEYNLKSINVVNNN